MNPVNGSLATKKQLTDNFDGERERERERELILLRI